MKGKQWTLLLEQSSILDSLHLIYSNKPVDLVIVIVIVIVGASNSMILDDVTNCAFL